MKNGIVPAPLRVSHGRGGVHNKYDSHAVEAIRRVVELKKQGFSLAEIEAIAGEVTLDKANLPDAR